jgi:hypothetical protein
MEDRKRRLAGLLRLPHEGIALNGHYREDGASTYKYACALGREGIVSKRLGSPYRAGRSAHGLKIKNRRHRPCGDLKSKIEKAKRGEPGEWQSVAAFRRRGPPRLPDLDQIASKGWGISFFIRLRRLTPMDARGKPDA